MGLYARLVMPLLTALIAITPTAAQPPPPRFPDLVGLQVSGSIPGDSRRFRPGERVPLEVVIYNRGKTSTTVRYPGGWWYCGTSVSATREGAPVEIIHTELLGTVPVLSHTVEAGARYRIKHPGLHLGKPAGGNAQSEPYLADPKPGKYALRVHFEASGESSLPHVRVALDPVLEFEIVAPGVRSGFKRKQASRAIGSGR